MTASQQQALPSPEEIRRAVQQECDIFTRSTQTEVSSRARQLIEILAEAFVYEPYSAWEGDAGQRASNLAEYLQLIPSYLSEITAQLPRDKEVTTFVAFSWLAANRRKFSDYLCPF